MKLNDIVMMSIIMCYVMCCLFKGRTHTHKPLSRQSWKLRLISAGWASMLYCNVPYYSSIV